MLPRSVILTFAGLALGGVLTVSDATLGHSLDRERALRAQLAKERKADAAEDRKFRREIRRLRSAPERRSTSKPRGTGRSALASAYGPGLYGNLTACGSVLTTGSNLVAHKTLPCGTRLTVTSNGRSVTTVVGDRGPYSGGREFDLGPGVWSALGYGSASAFGVRTVLVSS